MMLSEAARKKKKKEKIWYLKGAELEKHPTGDSRALPDELDTTCPLLPPMHYW